MFLRSFRGFFAMSAALSTCLLGQLITGLLGSLGLGCSPPEQALLACKAISDLDVPTLIWPVSDLNPDYSYAKNHYWNNANAQFTPACVVLPAYATHISQAVQVLLQYPDVNFAVKSGGHNANVGFSSTNGGVLIYFKNMNQTTLSWDESTADVQPGARWENAIQALEPYNRTIVGGRVGDVGVGGLLLGCGLSFLSSQYGLPCDNILNYEVVLSNASIVNANATSNPDLFWALKGGGGQFGIVTKFTLRTYPIGAIWGGIRTYSRDYSEQILIATQDFTENFPDPRAGIIVTVEFVADSLDEFWVLFFFYNGPNLPIGVFDKFLSIPSTADTTKQQKYSELLISNNAEASIYGLRYLLRGTTIPNLPGAYGTNVAITNYNSFIDYIEEESLVDINFIYSLIYQPIPYSIAAASAQVNPTGNLLGISADSGDHMWMAMTIGWVLDANDAEAAQQAKDIINDIAAYPKVTYPGVKNSNYQAGNLSQEEYSPTVFMNDASADQKVLQGYGDVTYQRLKAIQEEADPIGFFPTRTGGFKLT